MLWFISFILLALLAVQGIWMHTAFKLKEKELLHKLEQDLGKVAKQSEEHAVCFNLYARSYLRPDDVLYVMKNGGDSLNLFNVFPKRNGADTLITDKKIRLNCPATADITLRFQYQLADSTIPATGLADSYNTSGLTLTNYRERLYDRRADAKLIDTLFLDSLIYNTLQINELPVVYRSGILKPDRKTYCYWHEAGGAFADSFAFEFNMPVVSSMQYPYLLSIAIPLPSGTILKSMMLMLGISAFIIFILITLFVYFIRILIRQKKHHQIKADFISNMTHEFRTPLTNISLALENLSQNPQGSAHYTRIIEQENLHMQQNVDRILQLSLIEKEEITIFQKPVDLHGLLYRMRDSFEASLQLTQGKLVFDLKAGKSVIKGDETHLINTFYNLLDNAIKYRSKEPYTIQVSSYYTEHQENICISVEDTGIGMNQEELKQIFSPFYRASKGNVHNTKGFGIGLSYVQHIVQAHGGSVQVSSTPGRGSTFIVAFPLA